MALAPTTPCRLFGLTGGHQARAGLALPVTDVDRAKAFYEKLGWRLDIDYARDANHRVLQFTPPGSEASIHFGKGITSAFAQKLWRDKRRTTVPAQTRPPSTGTSLLARFLAWLVTRYLSGGNERLQ